MCVYEWYIPVVDGSVIPLWLSKHVSSLMWDISKKMKLNMSLPMAPNKIKMINTTIASPVMSSKCRIDNY